VPCVSPEDDIYAARHDGQLIGILCHSGAMFPENLGAKVVVLIAVGRQVCALHNQFDEVGLIKVVVETNVAQALEEPTAFELFANEVDDDYSSMSRFENDAGHDAGD